MAEYVWIASERLAIAATGTFRLDDKYTELENLAYAILYIETGPVRISIVSSDDDLTRAGTEAGSARFPANRTVTINHPADIKNVKIIAQTTTAAVVHVNYFGWR